MEELAIFGGKPVRENKIFYGRQYIDQADVDAVAAVMTSDYITCGPKVKELEEHLCELTHAKYAVVVCNGTAALHLAALAAGFGEGDEVIVSSITFAASSNCVLYAGAKPVFADINPETYNIDPASIRKLITPRTKAIVAVDFTGQAVELDEIREICKEHNLILIEDATEALGTYYTSGPFAGKYAGTIGDVGVYSFNGNKLITTGSGGMVVSNHPDWAEHAKHLSTQAKADELQFLHDEVGYNYRLTNLQAALGLAQIEQVEGFIAHKHEMWQMYKDALDGKNGYRILPFRDDCTRPNKWFFSLYLEDPRHQRDQVIQALKEQKIQTRPVWALIHEQADYGKNQVFSDEKAQDYRAKIVNLPCSTNLTREDCQRVIDALLAL